MYCEPVANPMPSLPGTPGAKGMCCPGGGGTPGAGTGWPNGPGTVLARLVSACCCDTDCAASAAGGCVELGPAAASSSPCGPWGCAAWSGWGGGGGGGSASAASSISSPPRGVLYFLMNARASSLRHFCQATARGWPSSHSMFPELFHLSAQSLCLLWQGKRVKCG